MIEFIVNYILIGIFGLIFGVSLLILVDRINGKK